MRFPLPHLALHADSTCARSVKTAKWIGDCFIYTNAANRLNYFVGSESYPITQFDRHVAFFSFARAHR